MLRVTSYARNFSRKKFPVKLLGCLLSFVDLLQSYQMEKSITSREAIRTFPRFLSLVYQSSMTWNLDTFVINYENHLLLVFASNACGGSIELAFSFTTITLILFNLFAKLASGVRQLSIDVCCPHFKVLN